MTEQATVLDFKAGEGVLPEWVIKVIETQYTESKQLEHKGKDFTKRIEERLIAEAGIRTFKYIQGVFRGI